MPGRDVASFSSVHLIPQAPRNAGNVNQMVTMKSNQDYLIDGRVGTLHVAFDWDAPTVDIDASVTVFDDKLGRVDVVWWDKKTSKYLSVRHLIDDKTGDKKGDKEVIEVGLQALPLNVHYIFFTLSVYSKGKTMRDAKGLAVKLFYPHSPPSSLHLTDFGPGSFDGTAAVVGLLTRKGAWWKFTALNKSTKGRTIKEIAYYTDFKALIHEPSTPAVTRDLKIWVPEAKDVAASDQTSKVFGKNKTSDCFVIIVCKDRKYTSPVVEKSLNPKWKVKKLDLGSATESDHTLVEIKVLDQDPSNDDDFLGAAYVTLGGLVQAGLGPHEFEFLLGPSLDEKEKPKRGVTITGKVVVKCEVLPSEEE